MNRLHVRSVAFVTILLACAAFAQQITGSIRGTTVDPSGAVVRDAVVTATQIETGLTRTATTDRDGNYVLVELPVGRGRRVGTNMPRILDYVAGGYSLATTPPWRGMSRRCRAVDSG